MNKETKRHSRTSVFIISIFLLTALNACGGGSSGGETPATTDNTPGTTDPGGTPGTTTPPQISGFDFSLQEGDFWEYGWDYYKNTWAQPDSNSTTTYGASFRATLGQSTLIDGLTAFPVNLSGSVRSDYKPRWQYLAIEGNKMYGSEDGLSMKVVFDAQNGYWTGGGFLTTFPDTTLIVGQPGTITNDYITDNSVIRVGRSDQQSQCETIGGITICGDESYSYKTYEYFKQGIGSVGYFYENSYSYSGGGFSSGGTYRDKVGLTASSTRQDTVDYVLEQEPNNSMLTNATPVSYGTQVKGHNVLEGPTDYGGLVSEYMNETAEIEPNSSTASAQPLPFPTLVSGDTKRALLAYETTPVTVNGTTHSVIMEDWYEFTTTGTENLQLKLDFSGSANADLDIYLFDSSGTQIGSSPYDNFLNGDYTESIYLSSLPAGSYRIGIDACERTENSTSTPTLYTLAVDNYGASNLLSIGDWFKIDHTGGFLTVFISDPSKILIKNESGTKPATTSAPSAPGITRYTTDSLAAGRYYIGVNNTAPYTMKVSSGLGGIIIIP